MRTITNNKRFSVWVCIILLIATTGFSFAAGTMRAAKLTDFEGNVEIFKAGGEKGFKAFKGMGLTEGDRIITGESSWALLEIDDDKEVEIGDNTNMTISELRGSLDEGNDQTSLGIQIGKIFTKIKKKLNIRSKYEVKTPTTVMGVRGTQFFVSLEDSNTYIAVLEGQLYAITMDSEAIGQQPDEIGRQFIETILSANQQLTISDVIDQGLNVETVNVNNLDLMVLESIRQNPEGINPELLNQLDQAIEEKRQEEINNIIQNNQQQNIIRYDSDFYDDGGGDEEPPSQQSIVIADISNIQMETEGEIQVVALSVTPSDATISATSSNVSVAAITVTGSAINITPVSSGTATITVTASADGYISATKQFSVTVTTPMPITIPMMASPDTIRVNGWFEIELELTEGSFIVEENFESFILLGGAFSDLEEWSIYRDVNDQNNREYLSFGCYPITAGVGTITLSGDAISTGVDAIAEIDVIPENESLPPLLEDIEIVNNFSGYDLVLVGGSYPNMYDYPVQVYVYDAATGGILLGEGEIGEGAAWVYIENGFNSTMSTIYVATKEVSVDEYGYPVMVGEEPIYRNESERIEAQIPIRSIIEEGIDYYEDNYYEQLYGKVQFTMTQSQADAIFEATGKTIDKLIVYVADAGESFDELPPYDDPRGVEIPIGDEGYPLVLIPDFYHYAIAAYDGEGSVIASNIDESFVMEGAIMASPYELTGSSTFSQSFIIRLYQGTFKEGDYSSYVTLGEALEACSVESYSIIDLNNFQYVSITVSGSVTQMGRGYIQISADAINEAEFPYAATVRVNALN